MIPPSRPEERGDRTSSRTWVGAAVDAAAPARMWEQGGQRIEPNPVSSSQAVSYERRLCLVKLWAKSGLSGVALGRSRNAAYGQTVWSWLSLLQPSFCDDASPQPGAVRQRIAK